MNNCPDCMSPAEAADMGLNPCRFCGVSVNCRRAECAAWKVFEVKTKEAGEAANGESGQDQQDADGG